MKRDELAILMAAGLGERMRPLTRTMPKPLIAVNGRPMIETVIGGLWHRGVGDIIVVTGYLGEQFAYLAEKYERLRIVANPDYATVNNISSIYAVSDVLLHTQADVFICEADLYVRDEAVLERELAHSGYLGRMVAGHSEDWVFDTDGNGRITRVGKVGDDCYNMVGISYFQRDDAHRLGWYIQEAYHREGYETLFWDDVVNAHLQELDLVVHRVQEGQLVEIDTVEELQRIDASYRIG